jgi:hypothetical protein
MTENPQEVSNCCVHDTSECVLTCVLRCVTYLQLFRQTTMKVQKMIQDKLFSIGAVPPGGIEGLWVSNVSLKDKVKDDSYLWMRTSVSRMRCALECTADLRCLSHFYRETSATCVAQDQELESMAVRNSSGFFAYAFQAPRMYTCIYHLIYQIQGYLKGIACCLPCTI